MAELLKDVYFSDAFVTRLGEALHSAETTFNSDQFTRCVHSAEWAEMALKQKMRHVTQCLHANLPDDYPTALNLLRQVAPHFSGFNAMVFPDFVDCYGLDHWEISMDALAFFTPLCSSEFAVRPFIAQDAERAMPFLYRWADDENEHLRRLASEGSRPRLPWAMALPQFKADPTPILPILEKLKDDASEYVRRSVANNLNDISKDNPGIVLDIATRWLGHSPRTDWVVKHACRTLLKAGNTQALILFGFTDPAHVTVTGLQLENRQPHIGDSTRFSFDLHIAGAEASLLRLEYAIDFVKKRGNLSRKVFHLRETTFAPGDHTISRKLSFANLSTRTHYPGEHHLAILVNGVAKASIAFELAVFSAE
jgi:3-methyladenine DNA glycosylase AlkC